MTHNSSFFRGLFNKKTHGFVCKSFHESGTDIDLIFQLLVSNHLSDCWNRGEGTFWQKIFGFMVNNIIERYGDTFMLTTVTMMIIILERMVGSQNLQSR